MPCPNCRCPSCLALIGSTIPSPEFLLPPPALTTVNRPPTNSEVAYSRDVIGSSENMVSLIRTMADDLEKREAELLDLVSKHKAAISPLRSFPPELLAEIFVQFVDMVHGHRYLKDSSPLMLMGICSQWRRIVLDTPRLWTKILTAHSMIDFWITQSKELPLRLELDLSPVSYPALEALIPHSHRWQNVDFCLEPGSHSILARARNHLHSLKRLNLNFSDTTGTVDFCEVAPQLTEIELKGIRGPVTIRLPWEQLRICTLEYTEVVHYVLQRAKNLWRLYLDMSGMPELGPPRLEMQIDPHTLHPKLGVLIVKWNFQDSDMNLFFSSITLPSLQTLDIYFDYLDICNEDEEISADLAQLAPTLAGFFQRSCTRLSTLKLTEIPFSQNALIECLAFLPSLVSLDIGFDRDEIGKVILDGLNLNHPTHVLPRLRSLTFRGPTNMFVEKLVDTLVASRRHIDPRRDGVATLENLTLKSMPPRIINRAGPPQFHRFVSEGLNITYGKGWL